MQPEILIIADDVTGALDSAAAFAARGMRVVAALSPDRLGGAMAAGAEAVVVATNSRELDDAAALAAVAALRGIAADFRGILFKKVDSRLKGHIASEIDALSLPGGRAVLACPAIPRLGRFVRNGAVCGAGVTEPIPVAARIGAHAWVLDAETQEEIVEALPDDLSASLFVGAAGLAEALAERLRPGEGPRPAPPPTAPALLAIGSRDPVTLAQVAAVSGVPLVAAPNGAVPEVEITHTTIVEMTPGTVGLPERQAGAEFARGIAGLLARSQLPTFFACGGETAKAILQRLGIGLLEVRGELLPGVPASVSLDGRHRMNVITKSGGFGPPDTLVRLLDLLETAPGPEPMGQHRIGLEGKS